ncbi:MAG: ABC transporter ATP-binding protein [Steroidobacteraceae bacterium]|jgi:Cu-processing system ATP-binding protein|nr:ABC transporter ATP-binding protein [Steroidobacteraceae bacterium]
MAKALIEVRGACKRYGEISAVDGVDLSIGAGEMFGLIGRNGAGKSTLFKLILGLTPATAGEIRIDGQSVSGPQFRQVRRRLGYLPENLALYDNLTGLETLEFWGSLKGAPRGACGVLLERVGLAHAADRRVRTYSKGMRQRLGFAQALLGDPALLLLDEPTNGLDPEGIRDFYRILHEQRARGCTILITSHILAEIQERVERIAILDAGKIRALGAVHALRETLDLPLIFELRIPSEWRDALHSSLAHLSLGEPVIHEDRIRLQIPRAARMAALAALAPLLERISYFYIREPSLEDVFLGQSA